MKINRNLLLIALVLASLPAAFSATTSADCQDGTVVVDRANNCHIFASEPATNADVSAQMSDASTGIVSISSIAPVVAGPRASAVTTFAQIAKTKRAFRVAGSLFNTAGGHYVVKITVGRTTFPVMTDTNGVPIPNNVYVIAMPGEAITVSTVSVADENTSNGDGQTSIYVYLTPAPLPPG